MSDARKHGKIFAEIFLDSFSFRRGLYDYEIFWHVSIIAQKVYLSRAIFFGSDLEVEASVKFIETFEAFWAVSFARSSRVDFFIATSNKG